MKPDFRTNRYDPATGTLTISDARAAAIAEVSRHYDSLFSADPATHQLRVDYATVSYTHLDVYKRQE